jgi:hypothetical protein
VIRQIGIADRRANLQSAIGLVFNLVEWCSYEFFLLGHFMDAGTQSGLAPVPQDTYRYVMRSLSEVDGRAWPRF